MRVPIEKKNDERTMFHGIYQHLADSEFEAAARGIQSLVHTTPPALHENVGA